ncbi:Hsp70 family protein [Actinoplanes sp. LDG1-06]|uniref:Hsp70 family protein n=1 Tax=Paractinoplanes ovalisporus TaxID=2810368 RepID=A0ABS2ACB0_9ACTN|nr:Hsp70 family protein [Actinoplanes ovalisporus]MBM2617459.1 Hsp70 family protein [Actinoplanes ovalisporus]
MAIDQGEPKRHALGVDFGTSNTVAVARWPDGRARPILVDGSPLLPSAVYAEPGGSLVVGRDAVHSARLDPVRFEPNPKRRIDDGLVLLGEQEYPVVDLIAGVLARVAEEWHRAVGPVLPDTTLTCPATWGATRRSLLADAAARAGLTNARLVAEPVAAATYFAEVLGRDVPIGSVVVVHDFGAGTFDASVVARTASGFEVMAVDGRDDIGGLDIDAAIVEHLRTSEWERLLEPTTAQERRAQRQLWEEVRIAKERLSRTQSADFVVPLLDTEVHLTRDELEKLARPVLEQTVRVTKGLLDWADLPEGRLAGVFLVGGASRIPLVATLLHRELGEAPVVIEQPELVVAEGSILADAAMLATGAAAPGLTSELRLVSTGRAETATVRVVAAHVKVPGTTGLQPAVDPWPDADHGWVPDPHATVPTPKPKFETPISTPPTSSPPVSSASPPHGIAQASPPHGMAPVGPARPISSRPVSPPRPPISRPRPQPQVSQAVRRTKKRSGFLRAVQVLFSVLIMIVVPLGALLVAYGYGNGESLTVDAENLIRDIRNLLGF